MYEEFDLFSFLIGLPLAIIITIIVFTMNRRIGKKKRWFDELIRGGDGSSLTRRKAWFS
jgi:hypothetical protein